MKKYHFWMIMLLFSQYFVACTSSKQLEVAQWSPSDKKIVIDGKADEWSSPFKELNDYSGFQYKAGNDAKNLYLCLRVASKSRQREIMQLGLSTYIDTLGKRKEKIGIGYPLALTQAQIETISYQATKNGRKIDERALDDAYAEICQEFELAGFVEEDETERIRVSNLASKDLKTAMSFDEVGAMICEFKIPFDQLYAQDPPVNAVLGIVIRVNRPEATADDDPGLFDDRTNNPITGNGQLNGQLNNPMMNSPAMNANQRPMRNPNNQLANVWFRLQLAQSGTTK